MLLKEKCKHQVSHKVFDLQWYLAYQISWYHKAGGNSQPISDKAHFMRFNPYPTLLGYLKADSRIKLNTTVLKGGKVAIK